MAENDVSDIDIDIEYEELTELVRNNKYPGDFSCSGVLPVVPDIKLNNSDKYIDPTFSSGETASTSNRSFVSIKELTDLCTQAPYGKDSTTVVDTDVRSCWQLNPENFTIAPTTVWNKEFSNLKETVCSVLAPGLKASKAELRLYKMLVYEKGSFFLPHRDTQRDESHFATVVVSLPVKHKGGTLMVRHAEQERSYNLEPGRLTSKCQWAAFFTDLEHEIKKITSGHRITLVYHLYRNGASKVGLPVVVAEHPIVCHLQAIKDSLANQNDSDEEKFRSFTNAGYILEHKYTPKSLNPKNLKGKDQFLYQLLSEAGFNLRLVAIEVRVDASGPDDEGQNDIQDLEYKEVEFSELDISAPKLKGSCPGDLSTGKNREMFASRLMDDVTWLLEDIVYHMRSLKRVDRFVRGTGNEGCDWHSTYLTSALLVYLGKEQNRGIKRKYSYEHTTREYPYCGP